MTSEEKTPVLICEDADKTVEVRLGTERGTVWLLLAQIAEVFGRGKSVFSRHLRNILGKRHWEGIRLLQKMQQLPRNPRWFAKQAGGWFTVV